MNDIGDFCSYCRRNDFLPFQCRRCQLMFCSQHRSVESHDCQHVSTTETEKQERSITNKKTCHYCRVTTMLYSDCNECKHYFCIKHRFPEIHKCVSLSKKKTSTKGFVNRIRKLFRIN